ncbi:unnamed protein product [Parnassius apollo]|uniref:(apollo) hypothetical protein n=1 Tax=Parnassius apollo TaxID=110799 RepID=A0A8S3Y7S2_PARAO|nr:unnamed protein product [Parnassius apollo]
MEERDNEEEIQSADEEFNNDTIQVVNDTVENVEICEIASEDIADRLERTVTMDGIMKAPPQISIMDPDPHEKKELNEYEPSEPQEAEFLPYNIRALSKHATTYELEKFEKNCLVIFNQENVEGFKPRFGTEKDVQVLKDTFSNFGFEVTEHKDFTKDEVFRELKSFSERDFTDYGCVAVAVLTHGSNHGLLRAKDQPYSEIEIINHFKVYNKPTLVTKPKILIIQACRGKSEMQGVVVFRSGVIKKDYDESREPYTLPAESDMLILHSSYVGHPSHRDELHGSWFIQTLCNKITQLAPTHDFESIVVEMPVTTSTLIRKLYLKRFGDESMKLTPTYNDASSPRNEVLDNSGSSTPMLVQFGPCSCFLDHFTYLIKCLSYYVEENPHDVTARSYLEISLSFEDSIEFNTPKRKMAKAICNYLGICAKDTHYFKYLYFYRHD